MPWQCQCNGLVGVPPTLDLIICSQEQYLGRPSQCQACLPFHLNHYSNTHVPHTRSTHSVSVWIGEWQFWVQSCTANAWAKYQQQTLRLNSSKTLHTAPSSPLCKISSDSAFILNHSIDLEIFVKYHWSLNNVNLFSANVTFTLHEIMQNRRWLGKLSIIDQ